MTRITQRVAPEALRDMLEQVSRGKIAFGDGDRVEATPVAVHVRSGRYLIGVVRAESEPMPRPEARVTLVVDDGSYWFELRAVWIAGVARAVQAPLGTQLRGLDWFEIVPDRIAAWNYATLHEVT